MMSLHAPMETLVIVNSSGPGQMDTSKMADTLTAEMVNDVSNHNNPYYYYICPLDNRCCV